MVSAPPENLSENPIVVRWYHWVWLVPVALFIRLWLATLRVDGNGQRGDDSGGPVIILLWHDKLFTSALLANRHYRRPITALISTSKDGGWLVAFFRLMGLKAVRGSSNRRGAAALIALTRCVQAGSHAGITPDGPKGPALKFKVGAIALGRLTKRPFVTMGIRYHASWRLRSWDRFALPMPFSRVTVRFIEEPAPLETESDEFIAARLEQRLIETS